jgi:hypothetical protein
MYLFIREAKQTVLIIEACNCYNLTYKILSKILLPRLTPLDKIIRDHQCGFRRIHKLFIIQLCFVRLKYFRKKWTNNRVVHQLIIDFKKAGIRLG